MTVPVEVKLSKLHNCLWKSSCQNYTTGMHVHKNSNQTNLTESKRDSEQSCVSLSETGVKRLRFNACFSYWGSHNLQHIYLIFLKGKKINHYLYASSNKPLHFAEFILQQNLAKNSVFKGIYCYYGFNTVALIPYPSVFAHWNRIGGSHIKIKIRYTVTSQMMWY